MGELTDDQLHVLMDIRLCLRSDVSQDSSEVHSKELLQAHAMRTVLGIGPRNLCVFTAYRSEPILGEAVAQLLAKLRQKLGMYPIIRSLRKCLDFDLLPKGEPGEVVARFLITEAYYRAIMTEQTDRPIFSAGCSVLSLFQHLFTENNYREILNAQDANGDTADTLETVFKEAQVRFLQTVRLGDDTALNADMLHSAFLRGDLLAVWHGYAAIDIIIPVLMGKENVEKKDKVTALLISVKQKNKGESEPTTLAQGLAQRQLTRGLPYIYIRMELGVPLSASLDPQTRHELKRKTKPQVEVPSTEDYSMDNSAPIQTYEGGVDVQRPPDRKSERLTMLTPPSSHPRFEMRVLGCSSDIYSVIHEDYNGHFEIILRETQRPIHRPMLESDTPYYSEQRRHDASLGSYYKGFDV